VLGGGKYPGQLALLQEHVDNEKGLLRTKGPYVFEKVVLIIKVDFIFI